MFAAALLCIVAGGASALLGQGSGSASPSALQESPVLEGIVFEGDVAVDTATVLLHRVGPGGSGEVDSVSVGPGGEFRFLLPTVPDAEIEGDIYFASVEYDGVLYFGPAITALEDLDSLYAVQVFRAQEVPPEGVLLSLEVRNLFLEFTGEEWVATDAFVIDNPGERTLVARENGVVWSYPLPPGATNPELGEGDLPPNTVSFAGGRVLVSAPLPPGGRLLMIRYHLESLGLTIPAPGRTESFELMIREPAPPVRVGGLEFIDVRALGPGSTYRRYGGSALVDVNLTVVETDERSSLPLEWLGLMATVLLAVGGFLAYARPRQRVAAGQGPGLSREALILEVARMDDALAEAVEPEARSEILERRTALLALLRTSD